MTPELEFVAQCKAAGCYSSLTGDQRERLMKLQRSSERTGL